MIDPDSGELLRLDAVEVANHVRRGELGPLDVVRASLTAIEQRNLEMNAVRYVVGAEQLDLPETLDGPLAGVPVLLKELGTHAAGFPCREGVTVGVGQKPAGSDAAFVRRLKSAGAVVIGTTATTELGLYAGSCPLAENVVRHPWLAGRTTGGSSSGSAAAVADGWVPIAHGTDGAGSLRAPAAFCGLIGLKPSRGRVSFGPIIGEPFGSLAVNFGLVRSVRDVATLLDVVGGAEPGDWVPSPIAPMDGWSGCLRADGVPLRICLTTALPDGSPPCAVEIETTVKEAARRLGGLGHEVKESEAWPFGGVREVEAFEVLWRAMAAESVRRVTSAGSTVTSQTANMALDGEHLTAGDLAAAMATLSRIPRRMERGAFLGVDLVITPTTPVLTPARHDSNESAVPPEQVSLRTLLPYTYGVNASGCPAMSLPIGHSSDGSPIGMQVIARLGREDLLLNLASQMERAGMLYVGAPT
jgi:amidase